MCETVNYSGVGDVTQLKFLLLIVQCSGRVNLTFAIYHVGKLATSICWGEYLCCVLHMFGKQACWSGQLFVIRMCETGGIQFSLKNNLLFRKFHFF